MNPPTTSPASSGITRTSMAAPNLFGRSVSSQLERWDTQVLSSTEADPDFFDDGLDIGS